MGADCPWINPKMVLAVHSRPCLSVSDGTWHRGDTAPKNLELNPCLALPDSHGGSSSEPHPGTLLAVPVDAPTAPVREQPPIPCHPIPDILQGTGVPPPPLCPRGPSLLPHGGQGSVQTGPFPKGDSGAPADLSCNLGLARPGFIFRPPGGEASRKEPCEPCLWLLYCSGEGGSGTHCPPRPHPSHPHTALWPLRAHWLLPPLSSCCACTFAETLSPVPDSFPSRRVQQVPLALNTSPETTESILVPSTSSAWTANPGTLPVLLQAQRQRQTWGHPRACSPCPVAWQQPRAYPSTYCWVESAKSQGETF